MNAVHRAIVCGILFGLGACLGSFLNVCVHRLPRGLSPLWPPSRCPGCGRAIRAYENVPILGWLALRGRCRGCRSAISARYPIVESTVGLLVVAAFLGSARESGDWLATLGEPQGFLGVVAALALLVVAALIAAETGRVPVSLAAVGMAVAVVVRWRAIGGPSGPIVGTAVGAVLGLVGLRSGRAIADRGDVALAAMVGAFVGPVGALLAMVTSLVVGPIARWLIPRGAGPEFSGNGWPTRRGAALGVAAVALVLIGPGGGDQAPGLAPAAATATAVPAPPTG